MLSIVTSLVVIQYVFFAITHVYPESLTNLEVLVAKEHDPSTDTTLGNLVT